MHFLMPEKNNFKNSCCAYIEKIKSKWANKNQALNFDGNHTWRPPSNSVSRNREGRIEPAVQQKYYFSLHVFF